MQICCYHKKNKIGPRKDQRGTTPHVTGALKENTPAAGIREIY